MKKKKLFKKSLLLYSLVVLILVVIFLVYIFFTLKEYESNQTGTFLTDTVANLSDETLKGYIKDAKLDDDILSQYKKMIKSKEVKYKKRENDNIFIASLNDRELFKIETKVVKEVTKLGMFTYQEREVVKVTPSLDRGLVYYDVTLPSNYKLFVNKELYTEEASESVEYDGLSFMYQSSVMPKLNTYKIDNLKEEVEITAQDYLGNEVELKKDKYTYSVDDYIQELDYLEDLTEMLNVNIDIMEIAKTWSLYTSRDLKGSSYGLYKVREFLVKNTDLYKLATNWATQIDIHFISKHTLKNPLWTNEKLSNFVVYGKDAFSCEVYLEKNMIVKGKDFLETMHDYLYFVRIDGAWKLLSYKGIGDTENE